MKIKSVRIGQVIKCVVPRKTKSGSIVPGLSERCIKLFTDVKDLDDGSHYPLEEIEKYNKEGVEYS